jgi:hypothetical protein
MVTLQDTKNQPSLLEYAPSDAEPGYLSSFEEQAVVEAMERGSHLSKRIRQEIAFIYEIMVIRKGDRKLKKSDLSFNKLAEMLDWGFSVSQWYRIGQAALVRKDISALVEQESWNVGNVDDIADSVLLDLERVEPKFRQEALELAREHGNGSISNKALEKAVDELARGHASETVAKPKLKKNPSTGEPQEKVSPEEVAKLQDMLVKERQRRQELEQEVSLLKSSPQPAASVDPAIIEELVAERLSQKAQEVAQLEQQLKDEIAKRERSQQEGLQLLEQVAEENLRLKELVQTLESQLKKVAVDVPELEVVPPTPPEPQGFWRRRENFKPSTQEQMEKAFDKDGYIRCDILSPEEQIEFSLKHEECLEKDLAFAQKAQKRHNPGSPEWSRCAVDVEKYQQQITFEQELRESLGYISPVVVEEPIAYITKKDADELLAFVDQNKIPRQQLKEIALTARKYERLGQLNINELQEVWKELEKIAKEPITEEHLEYIYSLMEQNDISSEIVHELILAPRKLECLEELRLCDVQEAIALIDELLEF